MKRPTAQVALSAFRTLQKIGLKGQVLGVFQSLVDAGLERDIRVWNAALGYVSTSRINPSSIDELIGDMQWFGPKPNAESFSIVIRFHTSAGRVSQARYYIEQAEILGLGNSELIRDSIKETNRAATSEMIDLIPALLRSIPTQNTASQGSSNSQQKKDS
ncbi:hypothetical protein NDN08_001133 [Rhodosorus marinus]|uniref:Ubiquinone biosynthesis protein n=1 Tax=Rhodosorus marinus TaxID=101924 RepID=A0AAV8UPY2_9RHOD|nr:hypothetical protein NDN08_001133 [Rhodosorus marinus]